MSKRDKYFRQWQEFIADCYPEIFSDGSITKTASTITFQVTYDCNLRCTYCYQNFKTQQSMSFDIAKRFIDNLLSGEKGFSKYINPKDNPAVCFEFIGGEPLLEIDLIDKITDYLVRKMMELDHPWLYKFRLSYCTNGILYFDEKVQKYNKKWAYFLSPTVSIDGMKELHDKCRVFSDGSGSYDIAIKADKALTEFFGEQSTKMTLSPDNVQYVCEAHKELLKTHKCVYSNCVYEDVWSNESAKTLYFQFKEFINWFITQPDHKDRYIRFIDEDAGFPCRKDDNKNHCGGNGNMIAVDPLGNIYPCIRYSESSVGNDIAKNVCMGNVWDGVLQTDKENECFNCMQCMTRRSQSTDQCFYCPIGTGCGWCSALNYQATGHHNERVTFYCVTHKVRSILQTYYHNLMVSKNIDNEVWDLWIPKDWIVPVIGEDEYESIKNLTLQVGGKVNQEELIYEF